jgi:hypothetical protein
LISPTAASGREWLRECHGFRVDSPDGRIGFVEDVLAPTDDDLPAVLLVRIGRLGRKQLAIGVDQVAAVRPGEGRLLLTGSPRDVEPALRGALRPLRETFALKGW